MAKLNKAILLCCILVLVKNANCNNLYEKFVQDLHVQITSNSDISSSCLDSYADTGLFLRLFDASVKFPNGLAAGEFLHFGNFDECIGIEALVNERQIYGKYCLATIPLPFNMQNMVQANDLQKLNNLRLTRPRTVGANQARMGWSLGYCIASTCSTSDLLQIVNIVFGPVLNNGTAFVTEDFCFSKETEPELSSGAIGTISFGAVILALALVSTLYDLYLYYNNLKPKMDLLVAFSFLSNGRKLIKSSTNQDQLLCLNGLRAISMMWVIFGHEYSNISMSPVYNYFDILKFIGEKKNMFLINASVTVDTFFTLGGLVTMYSFMRSVEKKVAFNIPLYYIHRYLRLTPAYGAIILVHSYLLPYLSSGPMWPNMDASFGKPCRENWWIALLYGQNYANKGSDSQEQACVPQSWYLSVDMQMFLLSPLILISIKRWPKCFHYLFSILIAGGIIAPFVITYVEEIPAMQADFSDMTKMLKYNADYYTQTYARFGPYVIGMVFGYYIYQLKKDKTILDPRKNKLLTLGGWAVSLVVLVACLYGDANDVGAYNRISASFYNGFARNAWGVGIGFIVVLCTIGLGGFVNAFLSLPAFQFLTKLSYSMYLVHFLVQLIRLFSSKIPLRFANLPLMHAFWGDFMFTIVLSILLCLTFESPIIILEKYLFGRAGKPKEKPKEKPKLDV